MAYNNYEVSIEAAGGLKFLTVTACDMAAAHADIKAAYGEEVEIVCTRLA